MRNWRTGGTGSAPQVTGDDDVAAARRGEDADVHASRGRRGSTESRQQSDDSAQAARCCARVQHTKQKRIILPRLVTSLRHTWKMYVRSSSLTGNPTSSGMITGDAPVAHLHPPIEQRNLHARKVGSI